MFKIKIQKFLCKCKENNNFLFCVLKIHYMYIYIASKERLNKNSTK